MLDLSIIIPTHNNLEVLKRCIETWNILIKIKYELIIIEDGCSDGTAEWLGSIADGNRIRWFHENDVFEVLCDIKGMSEARGRYVLIWQDDMFLLKPWLVTEALDILDTWQDIGILGLMRGNHYRPFSFRPKSQDQFYSPAHKPLSTNGGFFSAHEVDACVRPWFVRKSCIEKHGGLDESFAPLHWDEIDFHFRLRAAGWKVAVLPYEILKAYNHLGSATTSKLESNWHHGIFLKNGLKFHDRWSNYILQTHNRKRKKWRRISATIICPGFKEYFNWLLRKEIVQRLTITHAKIIIKSSWRLFLSTLKSIYSNKSSQKAG